ncbi:Calcium-transporting ATPase 1, endoplasmic reticulum-type [Camellia lanceoleosa]|uniref:Calcium-transporting ATPase 1, endoplasmic reticulum-type n=1 Tax=Camellia lanceoleosa TaxID=1840588 RepID=A0ACC0I1Q2_9ERIC|nr:Calcium-transporting ATPase 1, endoplasmic reticulum-type [Camellia lanceoleosa]
MTKSGAEKKRVRRSSGAIQNGSNRDLNSDTPPRVMVEKMGLLDGLDSGTSKGYGDVLRCCRTWSKIERWIATLEFDHDRKSMGVIVSSSSRRKSLLVKDNYLKHFVDMVKKAKPVNGVDVVQMVMCVSITKTRQILNVLHTNLAFLKNGRYIFTFAIGSGPVTGIIIPRLSSSRMRGKIMGFSFSVHWMSDDLDYDLDHHQRRDQ